ncbi:hypothetical protein ACFE04_008741 [Oxalis oulophora]
MILIHIPILTNLSSFQSLQTLVISGANLTGTIPTDIGDCAGLRIIDLSSNTLVGHIPRNIGNLKNLEGLILNNNLLTGKIPIEIGSCISLKSLILFDNHLQGFIPPELCKLSGLEKLRIGGNSDLSGNIPAELGELENLILLGLAETNISGSIPASIGKLIKLQTLSIFTTMVSGEIPPEIGNCFELRNLHLYKNNLSGSIPLEIGNLKKLEQLDLYENRLTGVIPEEIGNCRGLIYLDFTSNYLSGTIPLSLGSLTELHGITFSHNNLSGSIPPNLSDAKKLNNLSLDNNQISGLVPPELGQLSMLKIGTNSSLIRLRLGGNMITGQIPAGIANLKNLTFLDLANSILLGTIPLEIGNCTELQFLDISNNFLQGALPNSLSTLSKLEQLNLSNNRLNGQIPASLGQLESLNKLSLSKNYFSGSIPSALSQCSNLQLLDLSSNQLNGSIPMELSQIEKLEIALNLSFNLLSGSIPPQIWTLTKLSTLDLSHNKFGGDIAPIDGLVNLVALDISYNNFTGYLPDNNFFRQLPLVFLAGNEGLCSSGKDSCFKTAQPDKNGDYGENSSWILRLSLSVLITLAVLMTVMGIIALWCTRNTIRADDDFESGDDSWSWHFTPFQKLSFSVDEVLRSLVETNVIGKGCSGVVYRADMVNDKIIAVKELWPSAIYKNSGFRDCFSAEMTILGSIRHRNIVRLLACCWNKTTRLLVYDFMSNGSLEYGYMTKITEKSDVYSFGVVMMEVLTGKQPIDPTIPGGLHIVDWIRQESIKVDVLDQTLRSQPDSEIDEMRRVLSIALSCVNLKPDDRPRMKDVVTMLDEIRKEREEYPRVDVLINEPSTSSSTTAVQKLCSESNNSIISASSLLN